jgi:hypothetical protein
MEVDRWNLSVSQQLEPRTPVIYRAVLHSHLPYLFSYTYNPQSYSEGELVVRVKWMTQRGCYSQTVTQQMSEMSAQERHKEVRKLRVNTGRSLVLAGSSDLTERAYRLRKQFRLNIESEQGG